MAFTNIIDIIYPTGSIYQSTASTSPATLFGGTWSQIKDQFLVGAGNSYTSQATGGEAAHTLTVDEIPSHSHVFSHGVYNNASTFTSQQYNYPVYVQGDTASNWSLPFADSTGGGQRTTTFLHTTQSTCGSELPRTGDVEWPSQISSTSSIQEGHSTSQHPRQVQLHCSVGPGRHLKQAGVSEQQVQDIFKVKKRAKNRILSIGSKFQDVFGNLATLMELRRSIFCSLVAARMELFARQNYSQLTIQSRLFNQFKTSISGIALPEASLIGGVA